MMCRCHYARVSAPFQSLAICPHKQPIGRIITIPVLVPGQWKNILKHRDMPMRELVTLPSFSLDIAVANAFAMHGMRGVCR